MVFCLKKKRHLHPVLCRAEGSLTVWVCKVSFLPSGAVAVPQLTAIST